MDFLIYLLSAVAMLLVISAAVRAVLRKAVVREYQRGLKYVNGRFAGILQPGKYLIYPPSTQVELIDVRPLYVTISGQELLSSDGITLKVSLAAQYQVADPDKAVNGVQNYYEALYLTLQMGLRSIVGSATVDDLLEKRDEFGPRLLELTAGAVEGIGLKLISVDVKDIMMPGEVKRLFNQIVRARKEGLAALERARGETAALRNLANAARIMEDHPSLLQLRALQQVGESTGNTLVLGVPGGVTPIAVEGRQADASDAGDVE